jgi:hypothetical protein
MRMIRQNIPVSRLRSPRRLALDVRPAKELHFFVEHPPSKWYVIHVQISTDQRTHKAAEYWEVGVEGALLIGWRRRRINFRGAVRFRERGFFSVAR